MEKPEATNATILVIFGISGDLAQRFLLPALAAIKAKNGLPKDFKVLGVSRQNISLQDILKKPCRNLADFSELITIDLAADADYQKLKQKINQIGDEFKTRAQVIFYFAVPPPAVLPIVRRLGEVGLNSSQFKLLMEKPFGVDRESADELINETDKYFSEEQVYRIDHYLAKEMAQNITVFLGGNVLFRNVWNKDFISRIDIIASEKLNIEGRANFYESTGALRDFQSHLLQLAALVLMNPCTNLFDFSEVPSRRLAALKQLRLAGPPQHSALRAQYDGYRNDVANPDSTTETFFELKLASADPRWAGVPVRIITGKALSEKFTEIRIHFKKAKSSESNRLTLRIQPHEGIELELWVKKPGYEHEMAQLPLDFNYEQYFKGDLPEAYEQVIVEAIRGRADLFASSGEVLAGWDIIEPVLRHWEGSAVGLKFYKKGSNYKEVIA